MFSSERYQETLKYTRRGHGQFLMKCDVLMGLGEHQGGGKCYIDTLERWFHHNKLGRANRLLWIDESINTNKCASVHLFWAVSICWSWFGNFWYFLVIFSTFWQLLSKNFNFNNNSGRDHLRNQNGSFFWWPGWSQQVSLKTVQN